MKIIAEYHLSEREYLLLLTIHNAGGWVECRGMNEEEVFEAFSDIIRYMTNDGRLVKTDPDCWHWTIELTEDGKQALAKCPLPHTIEIEIPNGEDQE